MRHFNRFLTAALTGALLCSCNLTAGSPAAPAPTSRPPATAAPVPTAAPALPQPTSALPPRDAAPGAPIAFDTWASGAKQGFGTAFTYDQPAGDANPSRVWFAITDGAITEALFPDVSLANLKSLGVIVADETGFVADEMKDADQAVERLDERTPAFRVTSTDKRGRWAVVKEIVADPRANTILFTVAFRALQGRPEDYRLFLNYVPRLGQGGAGDMGEVRAGVAEAWDTAAGVYTTLASDPPPALLTVGYTGVSDLPADLANQRIDALFAATGAPGHLSIGLELPTSGASTLALGFGHSRDEARGAASTSLDRGFAAVAREYMQGWAVYLDGLDHPYPNLPLYEESLAVLKSLEDKTHPGAFVASPATPWGQHATDEDPRQRGARYVWPRDLYRIAMALKLAGDDAAADDALAFLDERMQLPSGGFPRNAFPDGAPNALDVAMDQVAQPILLAWHLDATDRYASLVKPAADFILANGPRTERDRWDEIGGYAPATLAAQIAALVCAADLAQRAGERASAARYLQAADAWNAEIERWTLTTSGPLGDGTYYLRASDGDPNAAGATLASGGSAHDQRAIVDLSFLELVRLGLRRADDPNVVATLGLADAELELKTAKGELYRRFSHDGYGESEPGLAPDGHGGLWPLLVGEHSIYDVARTRSEHPASWYLPVVWGLANEGGMLPQQMFPDGTGTGAATPHGWAHAEYILFTYAVKQGRVPDLPEVVAERYLP